MPNFQIKKLLKDLIEGEIISEKMKEVILKEYIA